MLQPELREDELEKYKSILDSFLHEIDDITAGAGHYLQNYCSKHFPSQGKETVTQNGTLYFDQLCFSNYKDKIPTFINTHISKDELKLTAFKVNHEPVEDEKSEYCTVLVNKLCQISHQAAKKKGCLKSVDANINNDTSNIHNVVEQLLLKHPDLYRWNDFSSDIRFFSDLYCQQMNELFFMEEELRQIRKSIKKQGKSPFSAYNEALLALHNTGINTIKQCREAMTTSIVYQHFGLLTCLEKTYDDYVNVLNQHGAKLAEEKKLDSRNYEEEQSKLYETTKKAKETYEKIENLRLILLDEKQDTEHHKSHLTACRNLITDCVRSCKAYLEIRNSLQFPRPSETLSSLKNYCDQLIFAITGVEEKLGIQSAINSLSTNSDFYNISEILNDETPSERVQQLLKVIDKELKALNLASISPECSIIEECFNLHSIAMQNYLKKVNGHTMLNPRAWMLDGFLPLYKKLFKQSDRLLCPLRLIPDADHMWRSVHYADASNNRSAMGEIAGMITENADRNLASLIKQHNPFMLASIPENNQRFTHKKNAGIHRQIKACNQQLNTLQGKINNPGTKIVFSANSRAILDLLNKENPSRQIDDIKLKQLVMKLQQKIIPQNFDLTQDDISSKWLDATWNKFSEIIESLCQTIQSTNPNHHERLDDYRRDPKNAAKDFADWAIARQIQHKRLPKESLDLLPRVKVCLLQEAITLIYFLAGSINKQLCGDEETRDAGKYREEFRAHSQIRSLESPMRKVKELEKSSVNGSNLDGEASSSASTSSLSSLLNSSTSSQYLERKNKLKHGKDYDFCRDAAPQTVMGLSTTLSVVNTLYYLEQAEAFHQQPQALFKPLQALPYLSDVENKVLHTVFGGFKLFQPNLKMIMQTATSTSSQQKRAPRFQAKDIFSPSQILSRLYHFHYELSKLLPKTMKEECPIPPAPDVGSSEPVALPSSHSSSLMERAGKMLRRK